MYKQSAFALVTISSIFITACQTTPREYNGTSGYQVENLSEDKATLSYTLSTGQDNKWDELKLQRACQKVLKSHKTYQIDILSVNEIINPSFGQSDATTVKLGQSRTSFGLSNTQSIYSNESYNTRQALEAKPVTLQVVRYTCTAPQVDSSSTTAENK